MVLPGEKETFDQIVFHGGYLHHDFQGTKWILLLGKI